MQEDNQGGRPPGEDKPPFQERKKNGSALRTPLGYLLAGVVAAASSVAIYAGSQFLYQKIMLNRASTEVIDKPVSAQVSDEAIRDLKRSAEGFRAVAKQVGPAVVNIRATRTANKPKRFRGRQQLPQNEPPQDDEEGYRDPFFEFFERFGQPYMAPDQPQESMGTGVIIDNLGHVVTNNHVVEKATKILVSLAGDTVVDLKATIVGTDPKSDLAVLKIESKRELPHVEWADSDQVEVGDWAVAIGSPFSLRQTVTAGIVSAKGRSSAQLTGTTYGELIQTDAAINPGNSGGPLCSIDGKVMGINTAIFTRSGGYMGIGFAIPSNLARDVVEKLIKEGKVVRGWLGVLIQPLSEVLRKELGIENGVSIHKVLDKSPADLAGIKAGDVVLGIKGQPVKDVNQLQRIIANFKPGETVPLRVISYLGKKERDVKVVIGELPEEVNEEASPIQESEEPDRLGVIVDDTKNKTGVVVKYVKPGSAADQNGIQEGDTLLSINRKQLDSVKTYQSIIKQATSVALVVRRKNEEQFFYIELPE